jgi:hypothetical protein
MKHVPPQTELVKEAVVEHFSWVMPSHRWESDEPQLHNIHDKPVYDLELVGTNVKSLVTQGITAASTRLTMLNSNDQLTSCSFGIAPQRFSTHHRIPIGCSTFVEVRCVRKQHLEPTRMDCQGIPHSKYRSLLPGGLDPVSR